MLADLRPVDEMPGHGLSALPDDLLSGGQPRVLRGVAGDWPLVKAARETDEAAVDYLLRFDNGQPVTTVVAAAAEQGRFFYRPESKAMNFERVPAALAAVLKGLLDQRRLQAPLGVAVQAISAPDNLPGFQEDCPCPLVPAGIAARLWIGNRVTVAPHFDVADNLACVAAGRRRFILFPPDQAANLYPGPMDATPAGVPISMVPLEEPDLDRFPRYRDALAVALVAELEPGDAIYIPYLWWHGVQSLAPFNILVNYWWNQDPASAAQPYVQLLRLVYQLYRAMPAQHRQAWQALYDHYVFEHGGDPMAPLSPGHRDAEPGGDAAEWQRKIRDLMGE